MTKAKLHPTIRGMRGKMGDMVFKRYQGRTIIAMAPDIQDREPTPAQVAHREEFCAAVAFGKRMMADPERLALYQELAKETEQPLFSLMVEDYFTEPVVDAIDLSAYSGNPGDVITITAVDDVAVTHVTVRLTDERGNLLEQGEAQIAPSGSEWVYTATVPAGGIVTATATAYDIPGHTGSLSVTQGQTPGGED